MEPVPDLDDLSALFGVEPVTPFDDDDHWRCYWPYSTVRFSSASETYEVVCDIEPASHTVRLHVESDGTPVIDFDLRDVASLTSDRTPGDPPNEAFRIAFRDADRLSALHVRLKPSLWIVWRVEA
jgi:hypothetical protein